MGDFPVRFFCFCYLHGMDFVFEVGSVGVDAVAAVSAAFKKLFGNCAELGIRKHILLLLDKGFYLFSELFKLGRQKVGGTAVDRLFVAEYLFAEIGIYLNRGFAVFSLNKTLKFLCNRFVALT